MINGKIDVFDKIDDINYIPVIASLISFAAENKWIDGKSITFFQKNSIFKYGKHLVNPYHTKKSYEILFNNDEFLENTLSFADSGGLQELLMDNVNISPIDVLKWQEKYCDIGFALDKIPFKKNLGTVKVGWTFDEINFEKCAEITKQRILDAMKVRIEYKSFKYYAIIQGTNYKLYKKWKEIIDSPGIDGWCCKSPTNSSASLAETAVFAIKNLNKPTHFLGVGQLTKSIILFYAKKYFKYPISFDSSSYDTGAQFRRYNLPFYFNGMESIKMDKDEKYNISNFNEFCSCPACNMMSKIMDKPDKDKYMGYLISLHNLAQNVYIFNYLKNIYKDSDKMRIFVNNYFKEQTAEKILQCFDYIDDAVKNGVEFAKQKHIHIFQEFKKTTRQQTLI